MTTNNHTPARINPRSFPRPAQEFDYELHHYRTGSEIRAIPADGPEVVIAEFPSIHEAEVAWEQVMDVIMTNESWEQGT